ncbi:MAG: CotH kinase family protein [Vicingaceae bacterium]|nr:CotH kinase family protein [Vicingaceae bacterium]
MTHTKNTSNLKLRRKYASFLALSFVFFMACNTQVVDDDILPKSIKEYHIDCDLEKFQTMFENYEKNNYTPVKVTFNGETRTAKIRVRGDTSRKNPKKSLKIKFDSLSIDGVPKTLNLNAEYEDKIYIRQFISSKIMQKEGVSCFNSEHVKVYLNGNFYGLFLQVENMDKNFLKRNNLSTKGNLYKATKDGACLSIFDDINVKWEKKTNKKSDHNDLSELIDNINNVPDSNFHSFIKTSFEYDKLINILALNMFLSNSSTYYHNYYLYHDLYNTGKWQMFPWDMDKSLSYYNWMPYTYHRTSSEWESDNPLVERAILCEPMFNDIKKRIEELHKSRCNDTYLTVVIDGLTPLLKNIIPLDTLDKVVSAKEWSKSLNKEKRYFNNHYKLLQQQFNRQPLSFKVARFTQVQTENVTFNWSTSAHPANKKISYTIAYGTDFLLEDSSKTKYITNITDTFYTLTKKLPENTYYWKVTAFDGDFYTDGFNTKNIFEVKKGTPLPELIETDLTLTKANSPYSAKKTTTINKDVTLTIEAGVEVHLAQDATITCNGNLISNGTKEHPIVFMPNNAATEWDFIYFYEPSEKAYFKNTIFKDGTLNAKKTNLILDSCSMLIDKKFMGDGWNDRKVLIYSGDGNVHIKNSSFEGKREGEGIILFYGEAIVENCQLNNVPDAIEYISMNKGLVRNNYVTNSPDDAIDLNNCNNILIENNVLFNNTDKGISIGTEQYGASLKNIQINNNLIVGNKSAISVKDSSVAHISNNTLFKNKYGIRTYKKREDYTKGGEAYIQNTIFDKCDYESASADEFSEIAITNSIVSKKTLQGENNITKDPSFVDAVGNNFHLKANSPCVSSGKNKVHMGAFSINSTPVSFSKLHLKSNIEKNTGDWIELINNYNIPLDLSSYKIVIKEGEKKKEFVFPIGTILKPLEKIQIVNDYYKFIKHHSYFSILGGLPKLNTNKSTILLINTNGDIIDTYSYGKISCSKKESITLISNEINDINKKEWQVLIK